ncbi:MULTISPECIES: S41 family peptidase [unclassified Massilia]|uniref:S41 family peptidase n=1 Tax=unclassified Massilia TaxID=2609279 RepID=UPI001781B3FE|nr:MULTISPECIES: S41 family peptidase [unclassified Massilia]MBD8532423.1 PDZ domain-containing protein [Massilia sp. CFBP 13647]MBD8675751.1 PDZ domain-containing protein [Massilia sp. CFBP 13721]
MNSPTFQHGRLATSLRLIGTGLIAALTLAACGGGGGGSVGTMTSSPQASGGAEPDVATLGDAFNTYWNLCAKPRSGIDPYTGKAYPDKQGTLRDELTFLRAWTHQNYLWYNEIPATIRMADYTNPIDYFNRLKTPAVTASGTPKDQFHFTYDSADWDKRTNSGIELGYGITWSSAGSTAPRTWNVAIVEPGSPAAAAGLRRGDQLTLVDGVDFVNASDAASVNRINDALFPDTPGESHSFSLRRGAANVAVVMPAQDVTALSVKGTKVIDTAGGKVGYLSFENHNAVAERQLIDAFTTLKNANVNGLVLDMRYNGGGLLHVAAELGYMIAGPVSTGRVFERLQYNDKTPVDPGDTIAFPATAVGFSAGPGTVPKGTALPTLGLNRVTILTTDGTCSASEAVINALRGIDVQVDVIGAQTCGKPYGFTPVPNCGTTYFSIEFKGVNAKGFGDYSDGFAPTCAVADDLTRDLGDPNEALLSTALSYRASGVCPAQNRTSAQAMAITVRTAVRPHVSQIAIHNRAR